MSEHTLIYIFSLSLNQLPIIVVCTIGLIAVFKSKIIPTATVKIAAAGFICLLATSVITIVSSSLMAFPETISSTLLLTYRIGIYATDLLLTAVGLTLLVVAIFSGRKTST